MPFQIMPFCKGESPGDISYMQTEDIKLVVCTSIGGIIMLELEWWGLL